MPIPSRQIGWSTQDNLLWQIAKQMEQAECQLCTLNDNIQTITGTAGTSGTSGTSGTTGTSGTNGQPGDRYQTTSSTSFTLGTAGTITVGTGLAYTTAQDVLIAHDINNHQVSVVTSYNPATGVLVFGAPSEVIGSGTYSSWGVNLNGAAGGNGTNGTSGTSGSSGINGTSGVNGSVGATGSSGTSGTSGTTPTFPLPLVYGLFSQTGNSTPITNTTVETTIINGGVGTLTVGANQFAVGDAFRGDFGGVINTGNNQTIRIKVKAGSVLLVDSGLQTINNVSNNVWSLSINFTIRQLGGAGTASIVALGTFNYAKTVNGTVEGFSFNAINNTTFDTTISNTLDVTVQWGAASTSNSIYSDLFTLNKIY